MNILIFCSNPVNGGTARIFYELVMSMKNMLSSEDTLTACVNKNNTVAVYRKIKDIKRLPVYSEEEICPGKYGGKTVKRIVNRLYRKIRYRRTKVHNISVMKKYLKKKQIDTVLIHNGGYAGDDLCNQMLTASYQCRKYVSDRIFVLHNDMEKSFLSRLRFWSYDRKISREATEIVTVSQFTKERIRRSSFISRDIRVICNGISVRNMLTEEEKKKIIHVDPQKINVLMIGNFMANKGQHKFLETAGELARKNDSCHFTIIGNVYDESYFEKCKELIRMFRLTRKVSIYQGIYNASEFIDLFDILAVPSLYDESFGLISVEAMANQRPVAAFACGGIPEVVADGQDGFVVPVGDTQLLAEKIEWLAVHLDERKRMGEQGRKDYIEKFSVEAMTKRYLELIKGSIYDHNRNIKKPPKLYAKKENCCGCTACYAVCPTDAIQMEPDEEGFLYPLSDPKKCIKCNKCIDVCVFRIHQKEKSVAGAEYGTV